MATFGLLLSTGDCTNELFTVLGSAHVVIESGLSSNYLTTVMVITM